MPTEGRVLKANTGNSNVKLGTGKQNEHCQKKITNFKKFSDSLPVTLLTHKMFETKHDRKVAKR
jgi:hypothetical protein